MAQSALLTAVRLNHTSGFELHTAGGAGRGVESAVGVRVHCGAKMGVSCHKGPGSVMSPWICSIVGL